MMKLDKEKWEWLKLGEVSKIQYGCSEKSDEKPIGYKTFRMNELVNGNTIDNGIMKYTNTSEKEFLKYKLVHGDLLFNRTNSYEHVGRTGIFLFNEGDYMFASYLMRISVNRAIVVPYYLNSLMNADLFQKQVKVYATKAVGQANINATSLSNIEFPIPPLDEQKQIATLFQSIETAIAAVEVEEGKLKALQKNLTKGLMSTPSVFGHVLTKKNCTLCTFEDIADCDKKPLVENDITRFIGLENIEPENFQLQGSGNIEDGTTFTKRFTKGDVLFGKRRAYLKKVAIADFDGLCSADILVLRAKTNKILPDLFDVLRHADVAAHFRLNPNEAIRVVRHGRGSGVRTKRRLAASFREKRRAARQGAHFNPRCDCRLRVCRSADQHRRNDDGQSPNKLSRTSTHDIASLALSAGVAPCLLVS